MQEKFYFSKKERKLVAINLDMVAINLDI